MAGWLHPEWRWWKALRRRWLEPLHLKSGRWGERRAARFLRKSGYRILGKRVRVGKHDELDLVVQKDATLIFVEVKTRKNELYGRPFSAVNAQKRKRLSRAAVGFLKSNQLQPDYIRFDVVEVIGSPQAGLEELRHLENAFPLDKNYQLWW